MFQTKFVENIKIRISRSIFFFMENRAFHEKMWKNFVESGRLKMTIRRMAIACWVPKATKTLSEYVTLPAFPL